MRVSAELIPRDDPIVEDDLPPMILAQHKEYPVADDIRQITSCYASLMSTAKAKCGLPETATLDDLLKRVIHGDTERELSFEAAFTVAMKAFNNGQKPTTKGTNEQV
jgi:hypothetical protein